MDPDGVTDPIGEDVWDGGMRAFFGGRARGDDAESGVLDAIERSTGVTSRVLLRDVPEERSPLLRIQAPDDEERARDDARCTPTVIPL